MEQKNKTLTPEQFKEIAHKLPEIRSQSRELSELVKEKSSKVNELFGSEYAWSEIYEVSFIEQLAFLFLLLGIHEPVIEASKNMGSTEAAIELGRDGGILDQWYENNEDIVNKQHLLWMVMVLQKNVLSIMLHHQSLGGLVDQVRKGDDDAFFKAVQIDRSILSCTTFSNRLARAELFNDKHFFLRLKSALKGPSKKHMVTIGDLRYGIVILREAGFDSFTDKELYQFFVATRLYPNNVSAEKNIRKHIHAAKKFALT